MILQKGAAKELTEALDERAAMGKYLLDVLAEEKTESKTEKQMAMTEAVIKFLKEEITFCENASTAAKAVLF